VERKQEDKDAASARRGLFNLFEHSLKHNAQVGNYDRYIASETKIMIDIGKENLNNIPAFEKMLCSC
jgi:hypothetical protein